MNRPWYKSTWLWKGLVGIYSLYCGVMITLTFLFLLPLFFLADLFNKPFIGLKLNHYWAHVYFPLIGMPIKIKYQEELDVSRNYIFCGNHFSFLDIAVMPFLKVPVKFVGKASIGKVPLFGYMFKKFHITVDRSKMRQKYASYTKSVEALNDGFSLGIFPEGGMRSDNPPNMSVFKEGPFRMSIETGIPMVPVSLIDNWRILPAKKYVVNRRKCRVIVHPAIDPKDFTLDTIEDFQKKVFDAIQADLTRLN